MYKTGIADGNGRLLTTAYGSDVALKTTEMVVSQSRWKGLPPALASLPNSTCSVSFPFPDPSNDSAQSLIALTGALQSQFRGKLF